MHLLAVGAREGGSSQPGWLCAGPSKLGRSWRVERMLQLAGTGRAAGAWWA